jgi:DNA ligase-associated metallophosphoesterase
VSKANEYSPWRTVGDGICPITLAGQSLFLLPERAVYWVERKLLFVADLHLGKDATFRQAGLAVPAASSRDSLNRLQNLIEIFEPAECIILGDLIHAADSLNERVHAEISEFFLRVPQCRWRLIKGNHDRHTKKWPEHWPLMIEGEGNCEGPFRLMHIPPSADESQAVSKPGRSLAKAWQSESEVLFLAGHIHPAWRLPGSMLVREKLACFWLTPRGLILPAFGTFTGTRVIERSAQDRIFVIADTKVLECG